mmetsp:Transcript_12251/g.23737  ORF Transcript_12251/g.23737 Transcript_12251/m.23737 type:complete len:222 (+) Transcript_12251:624-1289(+)
MAITQRGAQAPMLGSSGCMNHSDSRQRLEGLGYLQEGREGRDQPLLGAGRFEPPPPAEGTKKKTESDSEGGLRLPPPKKVHFHPSTFPPSLPQKSALAQNSAESDRLQDGVQTSPSPDDSLPRVPSSCLLVPQIRAIYPAIMEVARGLELHSPSAAHSNSLSDPVSSPRADGYSTPRPSFLVSSSRGRPSRTGHIPSTRDQTVWRQSRPLRPGEAAGSGHA